MQNSFEKQVQTLQVLYEMAMSIGASLEISSMLRTSLSTILRKLNCGVAVVYAYDESLAGVAPDLEEVYSIPRVKEKNLTFISARNELEALVSNNGIEEISQSLPIQSKSDTEDFSYLLELPNYGILLLVKHSSPLPEQILRSFKPLLQKLANSCIACENEAEIQRQVREKSHEVRLSRAELIKAKDKAESANRSKSDFLSTMTHELRTPMNGVLGMTHLLLDTTLDEDQLDLVNTIQTSGDTLLNIINGILDFSKIEANKLELEEITFHLRKCVEDCLNLITPKAVEKGLNLAYFIDESLPPKFLQDVTRVRQILTNLLGNAIKFTERGEIIISVTGKKIHKDSYELTFDVRDTGIGIPKEKMDRLFQSFTQVDASTTRKFGGTGLGLVISKRLCEMMGGSMWVQSETGKGATFSFSIVANHIEDEEHPISLDALNLANKNILLAVDNKTNRNLIVTYLKAWQANPIILSSFEDDLLSTLKTYPSLDTLILDLDMPDQESKQVIQDIYKYQSDLAIVVLTNLGQKLNFSVTTQHIKSLTKPIRPSSLYDILISTNYGRPRKKKQKNSTQSFDQELGSKHPLKILLAEDNLVNQKVANRIMKKLGYSIDIVGNGLKVLEAVQEQIYDLILMDINMPEMDGLEATQHIRQLKTPFVQPHIIALTANAMKGDKEQFLEQGMNDYLSKPIQIDKLTEALKQSNPISIR